MSAFIFFYVKFYVKLNVRIKCGDNILMKATKYKQFYFINFDCLCLWFDKNANPVVVGPSEMLLDWSLL